MTLMAFSFGYRPRNSPPNSVTILEADYKITVTGIAELFCHEDIPSFSLAAWTVTDSMI